MAGSLECHFVLAMLYSLHMYMTDLVFVHHTNPIKLMKYGTEMMKT